MIWADSEIRKLTLKKTKSVKTCLRSLAIALGILLAPTVRADVYSANVVGYVNHLFSPGNNLFENPLVATNNNLSTIFSSAVVPNGTTISLWNPNTLTFDVTSTYTGGNWSQNLILNPGTGALLNAPSSFLNTFVGGVISHNGGPYADPLTLPSPYAGPNGLFLLGDKAPVLASGADIFMNILGRLPNIGEQVITMAGTSTYLGGGNWDSIPTLAPSEAAFLNVGPVSAVAPVPEPSAAALSVLGVTLLRCFRRKS